MRVAVAVMTIFLMFPDQSNSQCTPGHGRVKIFIYDNGIGADTLWFGGDYTGTYGLDNHLCEIELPPPPPAGVFDARWVNIPGREGWDTPAGLGQGFKQDYRQYWAPSGSDTFKLKFQPSDAGYPVTLTWSPSGILAMCDSGWLQDEFGGVIFRTRMHVTGTYTFSNPAFTSALIILWGGIIGDAALNEGLPTKVQLDQNYPNPFNPSTTISFSVGTYGNTSLRVFNSLGQEVAVLVNNKLNAGRHSVEFNAEGLPSGMYYYRLVAGEYSATKKLMVLK